MITEVEISGRARKQLRRAPTWIARKLRLWIQAVTTSGLEEVRKLPGYHDEPLAGERAGQRSIRLSRSHRAIYRIAADVDGAYALVEEVTKHGY